MVSSQLKMQCNMGFNVCDDFSFIDDSQDPNIIRIIIIRLS